ncbi:MAG TPA: hypothetical protein VES20_19780 [Bryobacteraceae bacterium]|nr:hypothetical protein [Bryobacteraceae bacterium]
MFEAKLLEAGITPLDPDGWLTSEPVVLGWMPAVSVDFRGPAGNLLEYLAMLGESAQPDAGVVPWTQWTRRPQPQ